MLAVHLTGRLSHTNTAHSNAVYTDTEYSDILNGMSVLCVFVCHVWVPNLGSISVFN